MTLGWIVSGTVALVLTLGAIVLIQRRRLAESGQRIAQLLKLVEDQQQQLEQGRRLERNRSEGDEIAGIASHRTFQGHLRRQWRRTARSKLPVTLLMIDVDGLKAYNEERGRQAGNECLRQIATVLLDQIQRPGDVVARFGGDEFAVMLAETDLTGGVAVAERLREAVAALDLTWGGGSARRRVTISVGVASTVPIAHEQPESLVAAADRALAKAKRRGRNRIEA
jgi:diguanylate cyclase (GGDEF)-like protein